jgi:3' terminal RNA ribose 2'-O-methyltransferase Hen1
VLLTITTTHRPATDLGFLLHKNPANVRSVDLAFGRAHVFYPEAGPERCSATLLVDVDPIALVRKGRGAGPALHEYVNDRPYVASSFMSVAIARVYGSALGGRAGEHAALAETPIPLEAHLPAVPSRGGEELIGRLFGPLGYEIDAHPHPLDARFPHWGESPYVNLRLTQTARLQDLLEHLYVLLPVLDDEKHYWVGEDEIEKLLSKGERWLAAHPERELITARYLRHQRGLTREALGRLLEEDQADPEAETARGDEEEEALEAPVRLGDQRMAAVIGALEEAGARRVIDLGCGSGRLLAALLNRQEFTEIAGLEVTWGALEGARRRLDLDRLPTRQRERIRLLHGSLTYRDRRIAGYDAATLVEVIEHLDPSRLAALEQVVFRDARPGTIVVTTPNAEYNTRFEELPAGSFRHRDHRFEWIRSEFRDWADAVAERSGYGVSFRLVGPEDPVVGSPTQMAVFRS